MAPYLEDMTAEESHGPWESTTEREVKLVPEPGQGELLSTSTLQGTDYHTNSEECAPITDSVCTEEAFCRICHDDGLLGELLSPCECSGSLAMVHRACLEHWLATSNSSHCELCHHQFAMERLQKPLSEWLCAPSMQQQRRTLCGDALCFMFITPLASLSGWLCVQGAMDLYYTNGMEALGLLVLTLALFTIYVFWTVVSVRYHMHLFDTWRKTDQRVRLQIPRPSQTTHNLHRLSINIFCKATDKETMV